MIEVEKDEKIVKVVRKHWFVLLGDIFLLIFAVALPVIFLIAFHFIPFEKVIAVDGNMFDLGGFFLFAWLFIVWMFGWKLWTTYYLDILLITDKRVFNIVQVDLFHRESGSFRIDRIQNITVDQAGIIQTLLDFGTIKIETAGENDVFTAPYIAHPIEVKKLINQMQDGTLDSSQEVHLHPDTLEKLAPGSSDLSAQAGGNVGSWPYSDDRRSKPKDTQGL